VKLVDLLESVLRHSLQKLNVDVASHDSVLHPRYNDDLKNLSAEDQMLCDHLRVVACPRYSLAHPCELASQNSEFFFAPSKWIPLGHFVSWSSLISQLRGAMYGNYLDNWFAALNRGQQLPDWLSSRSGSQIACDALLLVLAFVENPTSDYIVKSEPISDEDRKFIQKFRASSESSSSIAK
jgi:hypothetical protein